MNYKVKIILDYDSEGSLENKVNEWLASNRGIEVISITPTELMSRPDAHCFWGMSITILYSGSRWD